MVADPEQPLQLVFNSRRIKKIERTGGTMAAKVVKQASAVAEIRNGRTRVSMELISLMITETTRKRLTTVTMAPITMKVTLKLATKCKARVPVASQLTLTMTNRCKR